jgi:rubrerythrin
LLSKNPLELTPPDKKFDKEKLAEALRLGIIAELDAINLYLQLAEKIEDEKFRKVFLEYCSRREDTCGRILIIAENN